MVIFFLMLFSISKFCDKHVLGFYSEKTFEKTLGVEICMALAGLLSCGCWHWCLKLLPSTACRQAESWLWARCFLQTL